MPEGSVKYPEPVSKAAGRAEYPPVVVAVQSEADETGVMRSVSSSSEPAPVPDSPDDVLVVVTATLIDSGTSPPFVTEKVVAVACPGASGVPRFGCPEIESAAVPDLTTWAFEVEDVFHSAYVPPVATRATVTAPATTAVPAQSERSGRRDEEARSVER